VAALLLALIVPAGTAQAEHRTETPLPGDTETLGALIHTVARDLAALKGERSEETSEELQKLVRENLRSLLERNLVNVEGQPFLGPAWTHYLREGRYTNAAYPRLTHVKACPICNGVLAPFGRATGVTVPPVELPFDVVSLDKHWYRVRHPEGYLFEIVDLTRGTTSVIPRARLVASGGRWWAINGWLWSGPVEPSRTTPAMSPPSNARPERSDPSRDSTAVPSSPRARSPRWWNER
jgi:hypothetical protein